MVPAGRSGFDGVPFVQTSFVQGLPSTGRSVSSAADVIAPAPSQMACWQWPVAPGSAAVPAGLFVNPQVNWFPQTRLRQRVSVPWQSVAARQATQAGADETPLHRIPLFCAHAVRAGSAG